LTSFQGGLLADLTSAVATLQSIIQGVTRVRTVMRLHARNNVGVGGACTVDDSTAKAEAKTAFWNVA